MAARTFGSSRVVTGKMPPVEFSTLVDLQAQSCVLFKDRNCFGTRSEKGDKYDWISYEEFGHRVQKFRNVLTHHR